MRITIVGMGIGGLTLTLMVKRQGFEVEVWEAVQTPQPLGVGINLLPHAVCQLYELGLKDPLGVLATRTFMLACYSCFNQLIWHESRGLAAGYDQSQFPIHRGEFQVAPADVVAKRPGADCIRLGHTSEAVQSTGGKGGPVRFTLRDHTDDTVVESSADVLTGADGIHSAARRYFYPTGDVPCFVDRILWRAITEAESYLDGHIMLMADHRDQEFVTYPISEPLRQQGRSRINWIAEPCVLDEAPPHNDWSREVGRTILRSALANWKWNWINIPVPTDSAQAAYEFPLVDKDPLLHRVFGRATLLDDVAHPMYLIGSNDSTQVILDACVLVDCLPVARDTGMALYEYEADRLPRTAGIVLCNRLNGPEQVMQLTHERASQGFASIYDVIPCAELEGIVIRYKKLAGFDLQSLCDQSPMPRYI